MGLLFTAMEDLIKQNSSNSTKYPAHSSAWTICGKFMNLLVRNYSSQHKVRFYANELNITPDYLNVAVKECTGINAKATIDNILLLAIKALLETSELSIKNIADRLHYDDSSYMCRIFRRATGYSPLEYRKRTRI